MHDDEVDRKSKVGDILKVLERAKSLVEEVEEIHKTIYQLAFIATSLNPRRREAEELLEKMIELGLTSREEVDKALQDAVRYRKLILDKAWRRSNVEWGEV